MPATFTVELDTAPPELALPRLERSSAQVVVFYTLSEPGDAVANLALDGGGDVTFVDKGDRVVGRVPWSAGGLFTIQGRDEVWNSVERSWRITPRHTPIDESSDHFVDSEEGNILESRTGRGKISRGRRGRLLP